ncbi:MAG: ThiF family adenylyltransferase [Bryobacteraceae bacterium]
MNSVPRVFRRAAIAGLGALGNELFRQLGLLGVGEALLIDPDLVEPSNLAKCAFFRAPGAVGRRKADVLAEIGSEWFPATRWTPLPVEMADVGWQRLSGLDVLFCGLDRDSARLEAARISTRLDLPVCDGGMSASGAASGRVSWFPGRGAACFCCRLTAQRRRELLQTWSSSAHPCHVPEEPGGWSATPMLAAMTAALQVHCAAAWLSRGEGEARSVEFRLEGALRMEEVRIPADETCPFHGSTGPLVPVAGTFREVLRRGEAAAWEWPVCLRARCLDCGAEFEPRERATRFRRSGRCPRCGSRRLLELETRSRVSYGEPWAEFRPEQLGLPAEHLYSIREGELMEEPA